MFFFKAGFQVFVSAVFISQTCRWRWESICSAVQIVLVQSHTSPPPPDSLNLSEKDTQRTPVVSLLVVCLLATTVLMHTCICAYMRAVCVCLREKEHQQGLTHRSKQSTESKQANDLLEWPHSPHVRQAHVHMHVHSFGQLAFELERA